MTAVRNLANEMQTIICTIHQPSESIFKYFDMLLLLSAGKLIYFGPADKAINYFTISVHHFIYVDSINPAEFYLNICSGKVNNNNNNNMIEYRNQLALKYEESLIYQNYKKQIHEKILVKDDTSFNKYYRRKFHTSTLSQIYTLCHRQLLITYRDPTAIITYFLR